MFDMVTKKKITVIIPFVNEGNEVENTLKSLFEHLNTSIDVIIINDASNDNFSYKEIASKYKITYIENEQRLGVAKSRDLGIKLCKTEYFLLLDAHMRFYNNIWINRIIEELDVDKRVLLCTQTKVLRTKNDVVIEDTRPFEVLGAYINYYDLFNFLEPEWAYTNQEKSGKINQEKSTLLIPCVLGAGYACSKEYWQYLRGLQGLLSYGNDEVLISLKVWMEGGSCKLLNDVEIGHIYRESSPYIQSSISRIYNRLYISYLLLPIILNKKYFAIERFKSPEVYFKSSLLFYNNFKVIKKMKIDLDSIFTKKFYDHENFNRSRLEDNILSKKKTKKILKNILYIIRNIDFSEGIGLINGKMGILILLYHYAQFSKNNTILQIADNLLEETIKNISLDTPINIINGLLGIGWGIEYLSYNKFIKGDTNEILYDIDMNVMSINVSRINDYNLEYGLGGIIRYILVRLFSNKITKTRIQFSKDFLYEVYIEAKNIIENECFNNCPETYIEYILFYEDKKEIYPPYIYDISILPTWNKYSKSNKKLSLNGLIGLSLEYILTNNSINK